MSLCSLISWRSFATPTHWNARPRAFSASETELIPKITFIRTESKWFDEGKLVRQCPTPGLRNMCMTVKNAGSAKHNSLYLHYAFLAGGQIATLNRHC